MLNRSSKKKNMSSISDTFGVEWVPLGVPLSHRLQTLAVAGWVLFLYLGIPLNIFLYIKLLYSSYWWVGLLYGCWLINDLDICNKGGRPVEWVRNWSCWRYFRDYFPLKLVKTAELDPSKNYLLACFPHGVICFGAYSSFATKALNFSKVFPGMTCNLMTLHGIFRIPFIREFVLAMGLCASSKESLLYLLDKKKHKGKCVALVVGGASEALDSQLGRYQVTLSERKGFIRIAMQFGTPIVPVFSFGEIDIFRPKSNCEDSFRQKIQEKVRRILGIPLILPTGRGLFQYSFGLLPLNKPITTVVGAPMEVEKNFDPTDEEVDAVHEEFTKRLVDLFKSEKSKYLKNHENTSLIIM